MCFCVLIFLDEGMRLVRVSLINLGKFFYYVGFRLVEANYPLNLCEFFKRTVNKDNLESKDY